MSNETKGLTLALAGDAMITRKISNIEEEGLNTLAGRIRDTDASVVNLEILLHNYEGYPAANGPGTYMRAPPSMADELQWCGFDAVAAASNHTIDYSHGGMEATMHELEERDLPYAGLGKNLADARSPCYIDTPGGRVALVGACSTITTGSEAGRQRHDLQGRPGLSPLRLDTKYVVPEKTYKHVRTMSEELGLEDLKQYLDELGFPLVDDPSDGFRLINVGGDSHPLIEPGNEFRVVREPNQDDMDALLEQIQVADRQADYVIASLHAHEGKGATTTNESVAEFIETFARESIDAGADLFFGHGSHALRGIEIYENSPVFYSLGNFISQTELIPRLPAEIYDRYGLDQSATPDEVYDARSSDEKGNPSGFVADEIFWETVVPVCKFEGETLQEIKLHPVDLQRDEALPTRGTPTYANEETCRSIVERLGELSEPYGTEFQIKEGLCYVEL
jgi:poly-gamma-glutamate synthesis protein (capsule biosynthesis protein)